MKKLFILSLIMMVFTACQQNKVTYVKIETPYGDMKVELYNETPLHKNNFVKLTKQGFYDSLLFHRIIPNFMIQGGDPASRNAQPGALLGMGGPDYVIDAEIGQPHFKGALAAARKPDGINPQKKSNGSQFYIIHGSTNLDDTYLNNIERQKGIKYNPTQREIYKSKGGYPGLDMEYTVFGMVVEGLEVIDKIASVQTNPSDRPFEDVWMKISITK